MTTEGKIHQKQSIADVVILSLIGLACHEQMRASPLEMTGLLPFKIA